MIGEIGGTDEERAAEYIRDHEEAGDRLHRRQDSAARQTHGPRRRDHLRRHGQPQPRRWPRWKLPAMQVSQPAGRDRRNRGDAGGRVAAGFNALSESGRPVPQHQRGLDGLFFLKLFEET